MPNALAYIAVAVWPIVPLVVFGMRRGTLARTAAWMIVIPLMFLPAKLELKVAPGIPYLDKHRMAYVAIAACLALYHPRALGAVLRSSWFVRIVLAVTMVGVVGTVRTNGDALVYGPTRLPGMSTYDGLSLAGVLVLDVFLPFAIGQAIFATERDLRDLFSVLARAAVVYAPLVVVELVLSPQLHRWVYGYHQHEFLQAVRGESFRPMVFMNHGLSVGMFFFICLQAALALDRARVEVRPAGRLRALVAAAALVAGKSWASIIYGALASVLQLRVSARRRALVVVAIAGVVVAYPLIRASELLPEDEVLQVFRNLSEERAESLMFRFEQERALLARARLRPVYGWGTWGRNLIWASWGGRVSIPDGDWVIAIGELGYVGFLAFFALLVVPLLRYARNVRRAGVQAPPFVGTLALLVAFGSLDLLPNSRSDFLPLTFAGALFTASGAIRRWSAVRTPRPAAPAWGSRAGVDDFAVEGGQRGGDRPRG